MDYPHYYLTCMYSTQWRELMETSKNGIIFNGKCCEITRSADDIALLGNNEEELQNSLHQMNKIPKDKCDMTVNK